MHSQILSEEQGEFEEAAIIETDDAFGIWPLAQVIGLTEHHVHPSLR